MTVFIPITKVDVEKRIVYGTLALETADKSGEILDYESSKAAIQKWSDEQSEASGGKSLGNVREMHSNIAAGKLTDLTFIDDEKRVDGAAKVVNDSTWNKVLEGVLTGFSLGGGYEKRWTDPENPNLKRYTPSINEFSLVDNPCIPGATFEVVKADGSIELRKFVQPNSAQEAQETMNPTATTDAATELTLPAPVQGWRASDGTFHAKKSAALSHEAELLVKSVTAGTDAAMAKMTGEDAPADNAPAGDPAAPAVDPAAPSDTPPAEGNEGTAPQADVAPDPAAAEGGGEPAAAPAAEPAPAGDPAKAAPSGELKKGLYEVSRMADLLQSICWLQSSVESEAMYEKDGSPLPEALKGAIKTLGEWLKAYVTEEVDELFPSTVADIEKAAIAGGALAVLAKFVKDDAEGLAKAVGAAEFVERCEKASKAHKAHLDAMFDHHGTATKAMEAMAKCMKSLGVGDDEDDTADTGDAGKKMAKGVGLTDEQLVKLVAFDVLQKKYDELVPKLTDIASRLEKVEATPAAPKGIVNTALVQKNYGGSSGTDPVEVSNQRIFRDGESPEQTVERVMKLALKKPVIVS